ncbi:hypothetical protein C5167_046262 [Papaver somniferum]|uniref:Uncharacterized protein n=1 Tax=Papaver somniferum TaxID=3469 RepID=A0A4Y7LDA9_PAPSO|nr:hypothetical protein C5167_046262 [Papaver somniferum]
MSPEVMYGFLNALTEAEVALFLLRLYRKNPDVIKVDGGILGIGRILKNI